MDLFRKFKIRLERLFMYCQLQGTIMFQRAPFPFRKLHYTPRMHGYVRSLESGKVTSFVCCLSN